VYALAAAVIGGLHSLPGAFAGGFVMGLFKAATARWIDIDSLPLVDLNATVALLLIVLLVSPDGLAGLARRWRARSAPPAPLAPAEAS
jgi:branched-subunit amino acid ABC-type transport system permease component